jgi:hypothetical protein
MLNTRYTERPTGVAKMQAEIRNPRIHLLLLLLLRL